MPRTFRPSTLNAKLAAALRRRLRAWYRAQHRTLPWRTAPAPAGRVARGNGRSPAATPDPYHVLVSEAMLQQTQVAAVIGYFERFIAALPTVHALAGASEQRVLRLWQGLGYYRRARNLHAAARAIVAEYHGEIPADLARLRKLPGVGRYTAGAIASIAFGLRCAVVDGNVARVLARWFALGEPIDKPATRERLWELAEGLVPAAAPGDFNQAMMELGATVCTPREPKCLLCPVASLCEANRRGVVEQLPVTAPRRQPKAVEHHILAIEKADGRRAGTGRKATQHAGALYLFEQRPADGLWSNMWQLPTVETIAAHSPPNPAAALQQWVNQRFGLKLALPCAAGRFTHQTTHRLITFVLWRATARRDGQCRTSSGAWRALDDVDDLPLARPQVRAIELLQAGADALRRCGSMDQ